MTTPFQGILDADTETFAVGPYTRAVRLRKWVYLVGILLAAFSSLARQAYGSSFAGLPPILFPLTLSLLTGGLLYFLAQYSLILLQVFLTYRGDLTARLEGETRYTEFLKQGDALKKLSGELDQIDRKIDEKLRYIRRSARPSDEEGIFLERSPEAREKQLQLAKDMESALREARISKVEEIYSVIRPLFEGKFQRGKAQSGLIAVLEISADLWRLLPPLVFGTACLASFSNGDFWQELSPINWEALGRWFATRSG